MHRFCNAQKKQEADYHTNHDVELIMNTSTMVADLALDHEEVMKTAASIAPLPPSVLQLQKLFATNDYAIKDVARAVELDPALGSKLLHLANSASRGTGKAGTIGEAIVRLGGGMVKSIAMSECVRPTEDLDLSAFGLTPRSYWEHTVAVVCFAEGLVNHRVAAFGGEFTVAALLHDFGKVVLSKHLTPNHSYVLRLPLTDMAASAVERRILSVDHAEVSAIIAQCWELPEHVVKAIQYHHAPELFDHPLTHGLNLANQLAWQLEGNDDSLQRESSRLHSSIRALGIDQLKLNEIAAEGANRFQETLDAYA
jgi:HD-like signal output (HDOD) protein